MRLSWLVLLVNLAFRTFSVFGQPLPGNVSFEHVMVPGSIRSSIVTDIVQDPEGVLWFAGDGLFRYDGVRFTRYTELDKSGSIASKEINSLFYDKVKKRLLIATRNYGVVEYNYQTNSLRKLAAMEGKAPIINSFEQTSDGKIWASSFSADLLYLENDTLKKYTQRKFSGGSTTMLYSLGDQLLVADLAKVIIFKDRTTDSLMLKWPNTDFNSFGRVTALTFDSKSKLYIGTEKKGVLIYDTLRRSFIKYFSPEEGPFYNWINRIFIDRQGLVWILTKSGGLVIYSPETDRYVALTKNPLSSESLSGDHCTSIIQDHTGIIWIGSTGDLNKYDPNKVQFAHITHSPFDKNSLSDKMVRGIFEDDDGHLLVGTDGGFINWINPITKTVEHIKVTLPGYSGVIVPLYLTNFDDRHILISSNAGVILMDKRTRQFDHYAPLRLQFENKMVRQILRKEDKLYLISSGKLYIHDMRTKQTDVFRNFSGEKGKKATNVTFLYFDQADRLWLGVNKGISLLNPDNTFTHYQFEKNASRPEGSYFMVLSITEIHGKLWVGTFDSGLWQMDLSQLTDNPVITRLQPAVMNNTVYATLADEAGHVWLSTNQGISKFEVAESMFTHFTVSEGLQDQEFNRLAFYKTKSGQFVFGGINGVNIFNPKEISIKSVLTKPIILNLEVNRELEGEFFVDLRGQHAMRLPVNQKVVTFNYIIPNYQQPARCEATYRLENHDIHWIPATNNQASYANLKPGNYTFQVRVKDHDGIEQVSSVALTIDYPFWQTWWFVSLSLVAVALLIYGMVRLYARKTLHDKQRLEQLLKARTKEIEKSREELEYLNQRKDLVFSILSHDLRGPLTTLKGFLSLISDNTYTLAKEDIRDHATNINHSITNSLDLIDNTLFWSLTQTGNMAYTPSEFSLQETLGKIQKLYQFKADKKNIELTFQMEKEMRVYGDENMLYVVLRNIVSNAIKFTPEGKNVSIRTYENHKYAIIKITDEGVGMSSDEVKRLIVPQTQPLRKIGTSNEKGTGLGLLLSKKFTLQNKGELEIRSTVRKGSEFTVTIPLANHG